MSHEAEICFGACTAGAEGGTAGSAPAEADAVEAGCVVAGVDDAGTTVVSARTGDAGRWMIQEAEIVSAFSCRAAEDGAPVDVILFEAAVGAGAAAAETLAACGGVAGVVAGIFVGCGAVGTTEAGGGVAAGAFCRASRTTGGGGTAAAVAERCDAPVAEDFGLGEGVGYTTRPGATYR